MTDTPGRLVRLNDAAAHIGCGTSTIRRHIAQGKLRGFRFGRNVMVSLDDIDALLTPIPTTGMSSDHRATR